MKKTLTALLMAMIMGATMLTACGGGSGSAAQIEEVSDWNGLTAADTGYEPNTEYDIYAVTQYTWEDIGETSTVLVCANSKQTQFELHFTFFGDEQIAKVTFDGGSYEVTYDKTGFVTKESPIIAENVVKEGKWAYISK